MRTCPKCNEEKTDNSFFNDKSTKTGLRSRCKPCERQYYSRPEIKEKLKLNSRKYRAKFSPQEYKERNRIQWRNWRYKISPEAYERMFKEQNGACAICKYQYTDGRVLQIDHNHSNGFVRGLLCKKCNTYMGMIGESIQTIDRMKAYLLRGDSINIPAIAHEGVS